MRYDFDTPINRRGTASLKWDVAENELPMWVADMDFKTAPEILEAMQIQLEHGVFGYSCIPDEWYASITNWWSDRHCFFIQKEWLIFCTGVIPALSTAVRRLTSPGENVLIQTPVYNIFFNSIINNGRNVLENPLLYDAATASYEIDWDDLDEKLSDPQTNLMILCNPHNPIGKIWDWETLRRIGELCAKRRVTVISDEIHCSLIEPGCRYVPFATVSDACRENSITCISPTKTFNLAGLQSAAVVVPDEYLRHKIWRALNTDEVAEPNSFAVPASVAAFSHGGEWLDELRSYISESRKLVGEFIKHEIPQIRLVPSEATYLLWLDCVEISKGRENLATFLRRETGLYLSDGAIYGKSGEGFLRMNVACPRSLVEDGLHRLRQGIAAYEKKKRKLE